MSARQNMVLIRLLAAHPLLTEAEARKELGLPDAGPDREDWLPEPRTNDNKPPDHPVATAK